MKSKPLFPNQTVTTTGLPPSQELIQIVQRIVGDILDNETESAAIRSELGYRVSLSAPVVNSTTTLEDSGLEFEATANVRYSFRSVLFFNSAATTTGARFVVDGPSLNLIVYSTQITDSATTVARYNGLNAYNLPATAATSSASTDSNMAWVEGSIVTSATGPVKIRFASEVGASAITLRTGSFLTWSQL